MRIDNSAAEKFWECPVAWFERYHIGHELDRTSEGLIFGRRFHNLMAQHNLIDKRAVPDDPLADPRLEAEVQATYAAYLQHYPCDDWEVVDAERTIEVPLKQEPCGCTVGDEEASPTCTVCKGTGIHTIHTFVFKMDLLKREKEGLAVHDYKTEKSGSKANTPDAWVAKSQVSLYQWAAAKFYGEPIRAIYIDQITRGSPKGQSGPLFHRQRLVRTAAQMAKAVAGITWVADQIDRMIQTGFFPQNTKSCTNPITGWKCDYHQLCHIGRTDANLKLYRIADNYLDI